MQFTKDNAEKVMAGTKTQTRRIIKVGERLFIYGRFTSQEMATVLVDKAYQKSTSTRMSWESHIKWQVGRTYAVCPGRGKPAIGRVKLTAIRKEKLQDISLYDCAAELGETMYDELADTFLRFAYTELWDSINPKGKRWADNPDVWALTFEVVP